VRLTSGVGGIYNIKSTIVLRINCSEYQYRDLGQKI
jgi:hypothetical protein